MPTRTAAAADGEATFSACGGKSGKRDGVPHSLAFSGHSGAPCCAPHHRMHPPHFHACAAPAFLPIHNSASIAPTAHPFQPAAELMVEPSRTLHQGAASMSEVGNVVHAQGVVKQRPHLTSGGCLCCRRKAFVRQGPCQGSCQGSFQGSREGSCQAGPM